MANKRHKLEDIVQKLRRFDELVGQGVQRVDPSAEIDPSCVEEIPARGFVLPDMSMSVETR